MRVPELDRLLDAPLGARIGDQFESLRVRVAKAVERIEELALSTMRALRGRIWFFVVFALVLLASSFLSGSLAIPRIGVMPYIRLFSAASAVGAGILVILILRWINDHRVAENLSRRFCAELEAARTPLDLCNLSEHILSAMREALGEPPQQTDSKK